MSIKTTKSEIVKNYACIIQLGYCELCNLISNGIEIAHIPNQTSGISTRIVICRDFEYAAICTGGRPFGERPAKEILDKYKEIKHPTQDDLQDFVLECILNSN